MLIHIYDLPYVEVECNGTFKNHIYRNQENVKIRLMLIAYSR